MVRLLKPDHRRVRNFLSRGEQWRLLLLFVPLGLVIIVMGRLRNPNIANRVNQFFTQVADDRKTASGAETMQPPTDVVDGAKPDRIKPLPLGAFHGDKQASKPESKEASPPDSQKSTPPTAGLFPAVEANRLSTITDNTYFRQAEKDAWFQFFKLLQQSSAAELKAAHTISASYVQLVDRPSFYRGKLIDTYGFVRQVTEQTPAPNDLGIKAYYRVVLQPADGSSWPIFVYCLDLPPQLKVGDDQAGSYAKVTGLFFKKLSYEWKGGLGTAPVIVANSIEYYGVVACGPGMTDIHPPAAIEVVMNSDATKEFAKRGDSPVPSKPTTSFRDVLALAGWSVESLAEFDDGQPLSDTQRTKALELLRRLRSFNSSDLDGWVHDDLSPIDVLESPNDCRGQLVRLTGRVTKVTSRKPAAADAERLEMPEYFECEVALDKEAGSATILTTRVPREWLRSDPLNERVSAVALYFKRIGNDSPPTSLWLAKEIAWHPGQRSDEVRALLNPTIEQQLGGSADRSFGKVVLGSLGVDVGLLDQIQGRGPIRAEEREAFYQLLNAAGQIGANQLARIAQQNLPAVREEWERRLAVAKTAPQRLLAHEALRRAAEGRYSVATLFNDAQSQIGRLFVFDGTAKRVTRVEVGAKADGEPSDVARRFNIDHYFEIEVFTEDSQNHPLVFCARDLPEGFPTGDLLHEPVRVAGFFFKDWLYHARGTNSEDPNTEDGNAGGDIDPARFAPLLIGRAPLVLTVEQGGSSLSRYVGVGLFLTGLAGIWIAAVVYARGDRRFRQKTPAIDFSLPAGQSLNELDLAAEEQLVNSVGPIVPTPGETS